MVDCCAVARDASWNRHVGVNYDAFALLHSVSQPLALTFVAIFQTAYRLMELAMSSYGGQGPQLR